MASARQNAFQTALSRLGGDMPAEHLQQFEEACRSPCSLQELLNALREIRQKNLQRWSSRVMRTLETVLEPLHNIAPSFDVMAQTNSGLLCPIWGPIRFIMLVSSAHGEVIAVIAQTIGNAQECLAHLERYEAIFPDSEIVISSLVNIYSVFLEFSISVVRFEMSSTPRNLARSILKPPIRTEFNLVLSKLESRLNSIDPIAMQAEMLAAREFRENGMVFQNDIRRRNRAQKINRWLDPSDFSSRLEFLTNSRSPETCQWLFRRQEYQNWASNRSSMGSSGFLLAGGPGHGKSVLLGSAVSVARVDGIPVLYSFFHRSGLKGQSKTVVLQDMVFQLIEYCGEDVYDYLEDIYPGHGRKHPSFEHLWVIFSEFIRTFPEIRCFIDAIDECVATDRLILFQHLNSLSKTHTGFKFFCTTRLNFGEFDQLAHGAYESIVLSKDHVQDDINTMLQATICSSSRLSHQSVRDEIYQVISSSANGSFLYAKLMLAELELAPGIYDLRKKLQNTPVGLNEIYSQIILRLRSNLSPEGLDLSYSVLRYCAVAARPLTLYEFEQAFAMGKTKPKEDLDEDCLLFDAREEILGACGDLITIYPDGTIQLIHQSLRDFIFSGVKLVLNPGDGFGVEESHHSTADTSLRYLNMEALSSSLACTDTSVLDARYPFLKYSSKYWIQHLTTSGIVETIKPSSVTAFFESQQGLFWLQYVSSAQLLSVEDLLFLKSQLVAWAQKNQNSTELLESSLEALINRRYHFNKQLLGDNHDRTLESARQVARLYMSTGVHRPAVDFLETLLENQGGLYGLGQNGADIMEDICVSKSALGLYDEAQKLIEDVASYRRQHLGSRHVKTLGTSLKLIHILRCKGQFREANDLGLSTLSRLEELLGSLSLEGATCLFELGLIAETMGLYECARSYCERSFQARLVILGPNHLQTLQSQAAFAFTLRRFHHVVEAETEFYKTIEVVKPILGERHPDVQRCQQEIAMIRQDLGDLETACVLHTQLLKTRSEDQGPEHPSTLDSADRLGVIVRLQGKLKQAERYHEMAAKTRKQQFGDTHASYLKSLSNLGVVWRLQGRYQESKNLLTKVYREYRTLLGSENRASVRVATHLGITLCYTGDTLEALELLQTAVSERERDWGPNHSKCLETMEGLGLAFMCNGELQEARDILKHTISLRSKSTVNDNIDLAENYLLLGCVAFRQGLYDESSKLFQKRTSVSENQHRIDVDRNLSFYYFYLASFFAARQDMCYLKFMGWRFMVDFAGLLYLVVLTGVYYFFCLGNPRHRTLMGRNKKDNSSVSEHGDGYSYEQNCSLL